MRAMRVTVVALLVALSGCIVQSGKQDPQQVPDPTPMPDKPRPDAGPPGDPTSLPAQAQACPEGACAEGLECVEYYGIAGPKGGKLTSCEIRCNVTESNTCPGDQQCVTISDGPGQVCRAVD
jgi:hypothetical protein